MSNNMFDMIKQATQLKAQMAKIEKELTDMRFQGEITKGLIRIIAISNGKQEIIGLSLPEEAKTIPVTEMSKLILQAITRAQQSAKDEAARIARNLQLG